MISLLTSFLLVYYPKSDTDIILLPSNDNCHNYSWSLFYHIYPREKEEYPYTYCGGLLNGTKNFYTRREEEA